MNFLIDAQLPPRLTELFPAGGHTCFHTSDLPEKNLTSDVEILELSIPNNWVVITKDSDFFHSFVLYRKPYKLVLVTLGNLRASQTQTYFADHLTTLLSVLEKHHLVELSVDGVIVME